MFALATPPLEKPLKNRVRISFLAIYRHRLGDIDASFVWCAFLSPLSPLPLTFIPARADVSPADPTSSLLALNQHFEFIC